MDQLQRTLTNILLTLLLLVLAVLLLRVDAIVSYVSCSTDPMIASMGTDAEIRIDRCRRHLNQGDLQ